MGPAGSKTNPGQMEPTMTTKTTKLDAALAAMNDAERAHDFACYTSKRTRIAINIVEAGGKLTESQEDTLIDACRTKIGNLAFHMTHAELAVMAAEVIKSNIEATWAVLGAALDEMDRQERIANQRAARREARKAA